MDDISKFLRELFSSFSGQKKYNEFSDLDWAKLGSDNAKREETGHNLYKLITRFN